VQELLGVVRKIEQTPFERGRTDIGDEYFHLAAGAKGRVTRSLEPFAEDAESFMRPGNHLDGHDRADLGGGGGTSIGGGLDTGDVTTEKAGDIAGTDFFPAGEIDVGGLEGGVGRFEERAQTLAFDHSNCLLSHNIILS
jgi:hypothetical protein